MNVEITFRADTQGELESAIASMLRRCGWQCSRAVPWQTPKAVQAELGLATPGILTMRLTRFIQRGGSFPAKRGASGRILQLQVTSELRDYFEKLAGCIPKGS